MNVSFLSHSTYWRFNDRNYREMSRWACWGSYFGSLEMTRALENNRTVNTKGFTWVIYTKESKDHSNNYCLLTKDEIIEYLSLLQKIFRFKSFELVEDDTLYTNIPTANRILVNMEFGISYWAVRLLLTWCRLLYEVPGNVILKEVVNLHRNGMFTNLNMVNLYCVVANIYLLEGTGHSLYRRRLFSTMFSESRSMAEYKEGQPLSPYHNTVLTKEDIQKGKSVLCYYDTIEEWAKRVKNYPLNSCANYFIPCIHWGDFEHLESNLPKYSETRLTNKVATSIEKGEISEKRVIYYIALINLIEKYRPTSVYWQPNFNSK